MFPCDWWTHNSYTEYQAGSTTNKSVNLAVATSSYEYQAVSIHRERERHQERPGETRLSSVYGVYLAQTSQRSHSVYHQFLALFKLLLSHGSFKLVFKPCSRLIEETSTTLKTSLDVKELFSPFQSKFWWNLNPLNYFLMLLNLLLLDFSLHLHSLPWNFPLQDQFQCYGIPKSRPLLLISFWHVYLYVLLLKHLITINPPWFFSRVPSSYKWI